MINSTAKIDELLGPGPYPIDPGTPEFFSAIGLYLSNNAAVLRPRVTVIEQDSSHSHAHDSYEFTIPFSGNPLLRHDKKIIRLNSGMLLPCNPGQKHGPAERITEADFLVLQIGKNFMQNLARAAYRTGGEIFFSEEPLKPSPELIRQIHDFTAECSGNNTGRDIYLDTLEVQIALTLLRQVPHNSRSSSREYAGNCRSNIIRAMEIMRAHFDEDFSSEKLADTARMSRYHFFRVFKTHTGKTPYDYLTEVRVEKAQELLRNRDLSITDICYRCGFSSHSHFTSLFRKKTGTTPSQYRSIHIKNFKKEDSITE